MDTTWISVLTHILAFAAGAGLASVVLLALGSLADPPAPRS